MILTIFSVYDIKAEIYHSPFYAQNAGHASRIFSQAVNKSGTQFNEFPEDFRLYEIGSFNDSAGLISGYDATKFVCNAETLKDSSNGGNKA